MREMNQALSLDESYRAKVQGLGWVWELKDEALEVMSESLK